MIICLALDICQQGLKVFRTAAMHNDGDALGLHRCACAQAAVDAFDPTIGRALDLLALDDLVPILDDAKRAVLAAPSILGLAQ